MTSTVRMIPTEWESKRFAVATIGFQSIFEMVPDITPAVIDGVQNIIGYSLFCFPETEFEIMVKRMRDFIFAFSEFYKTRSADAPEQMIISDGYLFILQRFPSKYTCNQCMVSHNFYHLLESIRILANLLQTDISRFKKNPNSILSVSSRIHYSAGDETPSTDESPSPTSPNGEPRLGSQGL